MSSFANAFSTVTNKTTTENGAVVNESTGNPVLDFSHKVLRDTSVDEINERIDKILTYVQTTNNVEHLVDLLILAFHKRNPRGGEGERLMTYRMLIKLYDVYPETIVKLVHQLPDFGYFKDFFQIWENIWTFVKTEVEKVPSSERLTAKKFYHKKYYPLINEIVKYTIMQRNADLDTLKNNGTTISLVGKWIPREGSHYSKVCWYVPDRNGVFHTKNVIDLLVFHLAERSGNRYDFSTNKDVMKKWYRTYRVGNKLLNTKLDVPEIAMCANNYSLIKFEAVSAKAMAKYRKAFMNEKLKQAPKGHEEDTGNRYPSRPDRIEARTHLKELLTSKGAEKMKSEGLEPHELLEKLLAPNLSTMDKDTLLTLWEAKKLDVKRHLKEMLETMKQLGTDLGDAPVLGKIIPMVDVSGSMTWGSKPLPLNIAVALGIMTAELHEDGSPFKNLLMRFSDQPHFFSLNEGENLIQRYHTVTGNVGYNTNFRLAMEELLNLCVSKHVKEEDIPDLLVYTDGQFDSMNSAGFYTESGYKQNTNKWNTHHEELMKMWAEAGYGKIPRIIYWNLRGGTPGVQTSKDHSGVQMLQGYSPNLLKFVLYGEAFGSKTQEVEVNGKKIKMNVSSVTPWETFRAIIDQSRYDVLRLILSDSNENMLSQYKYTPAIEPEMVNVPNTKEDISGGESFVNGGEATTEDNAGFELV